VFSTTGCCSPRRECLTTHPHSSINPNHLCSNTPKCVPAIPTQITPPKHHVNTTKAQIILDKPKMVWYTLSANRERKRVGQSHTNQDNHTAYDTLYIYQKMNQIDGIVYLIKWDLLEYPTSFVSLLQNSQKKKVLT
jgi:hypothetical protein